MPVGMKPNRLLRRVNQATALVLSVAILFASPSQSRAQSEDPPPVYTSHNYWGIDGWLVERYLPPTQLQFAYSNKIARLSWPLTLSNAILQTTTDVGANASWQTVTYTPVALEEDGAWRVTMPASGARQFFRLSGTGALTIPVFAFAAFANGQMELVWNSPQIFRGRVHANGPICPGPPSSSFSTFLKTVSTASSIVYSNLGGYPTNLMTGPVNYYGSPQSRTNTPRLTLTDVKQNDNYREIVEMPPPGEPTTNGIGAHRYFNKASFVLLVSNATVSLTVKDQGAQTGLTTNLVYDSSAPTLVQQTNLGRAFPFLALTNTFTDYRESKRVKVTQINVGMLKNWLLTNSMVLARYPTSDSPPYPNIMYVGDFRTVSTNLYAVRLTNGVVIPTNGPSAALATGFTLATPNPLYVWGHYNCPNAAHLGVTNTTETFPASLVCDAITILSPDWRDNDSSNLSHSSRNAADTTINAAFIAGAVYTTGTASGQWSGGWHNLPRLIEDWSGRTLTINGSFVNLYPSARATNQFQNPGVYYNAPNRNFNFDQNFNSLAKLPPGTPTVTGVAPLE